MSHRQLTGRHRTWQWTSGLLLCLATMTVAAAPTPAVPRPVTVVFDTDMYGDIDDALALATLHALADRGEARIAAVTLSTEGRWPAAFVEAVNRYYGRGDIPVGVVRDGVTEQDTIDAFGAHGWMPWLPSPRGVNYTQFVAQLEGADDSPASPGLSGAERPSEDAVRLLRRVLAAAPDGSVVMVLGGFSTNLARLAGSPPDDISPLDGRSLVAARVRQLVAMAGNFSSAGGGSAASANKPEFNLLMDASSAQQRYARGPTPIVFSGYEIGSRVRFEQSAAERGFGHLPGHPVGAAFSYAVPHYQQASGRPASPHDHATFDVTAVIHAVRPDDGYFTLSQPGTVSVLADGSSRFARDASGRHRYLVLDDAQKPRLQEAIALLVSQPPVRQR